jgi:hypothetical protein
MLFLSWLVDLFEIKMNEPAVLGGFHIACVLSVLLCTVILCSLFSDASDATYRAVMGSAFLVMLVLEVAKQVALTAEAGEYPWEIFPFQLCSTPLYVLPLLALLPDSTPRDVLAAYTMTYAFIGGLAMYLVPEPILGEGVMLNVQTMVHHGLQIVTGAYTAAYYRSRLGVSFFVGGVSLFALFYSVANLLNSVGYDLLVSRGLLAEGASFNMFNLTPRDGQRMHVLSGVVDSLPPFIFIVGYFFVLTAAAALIICIHYLIFNYRINKENDYVKM